MTPVIVSSVRLLCVAESDVRATITSVFTSCRAESSTKRNTADYELLRLHRKGFYACRTTIALRTIEAKAKINFPIVGSASGNCIIAPDGAVGLPPFTV